MLAALPSTRNDIGRRSIWKQAASYGRSSTSEATFGVRSFAFFSDPKALENMGKVGDHKARVKRWLECLNEFDYTLEYRKGSANGNADFLSQLPQPATEHDRSGSSRLTPPSTTPSTSVPGIGLGGLVPQPDSAVLCGLPRTSTDFRVLRVHGPRMRIDDLSAPTGRFAARVPAFVGTGDDHLGRASFWSATDATFFRFSRCPPGLLRRNHPRGALRPHRRLRWDCRLRTASPLGRAEEQPLQPVLRSLPLIMVLDAAGFPGRLEPQRLSRRYPSRLTATERSFGCPTFRALDPFGPCHRPYGRFGRPRRCCQTTLQ